MTVNFVLDVIRTMLETHNSKVLAGSSMARNQTLSAMAQRLLPHCSLGTGIRRIKALEPQAEFINAHDTLTVRLPRKATVS